MNRPESGLGLQLLLGHNQLKRVGYLDPFGAGSLLRASLRHEQPTQERYEKVAPSGPSPNDEATALAL